MTEILNSLSTTVKIFFFFFALNQSYNAVDDIVGSRQKASETAFLAFAVR
jgi:hypothetical protein